MKLWKMNFNFKSKRVEYIIIFLLLIMFFIMLLNFGFKSGFSKMGAESLISVIGALLFGIYSIYHIQSKLTVQGEYSNYYSAIIFKDSNKVVQLPLFYNTDPSVNSKRFYFNLQAFTNKLKTIYPEGLTSKAELDLFEAAFLTTFPLDYRGTEVSETAVIKRLDASTAENSITNSDLGSIYRDLEVKILPGAIITLLSENESRVYTINHPHFEVIVRLLRIGPLNINPESNNFHRWMVKKYDPLPGSYSARKFMIFLTINKKEYFEIADNKKSFESFFDNIKKNIELDFAWPQVEDGLKSQYLIDLAEASTAQQSK